MTETKTLGSDSYIWPADSKISTICDGQIVNQIVDDFGVSVKISVVSKDSFNEYGDATVSETFSYSKAYIHQWTARDDEVKEGIYKAGELMFVFKSSDSAKLVPGNRVFYSNEWYEILSVDKNPLAGTTYLINVKVSKLTK